MLPDKLKWRWQGCIDYHTTVQVQNDARLLLGSKIALVVNRRYRMRYQATAIRAVATLIDTVVLLIPSCVDGPAIIAA